MKQPYSARPLQDGDIPAIVNLIAHKKQQLGVDFWLPEFSDPRTYRVFVLEAHGEIIGAAVFRTIWELILAADNPLAMLAGIETQAEIREELQRAMVDQVVAFVPEKLVSWNRDGGRMRKSGMERLIERLGFRRINNMVAFETEV